MELKINEEVKNELFNRKEVKAEIETKVTPSTSDALKALATKYKVSEDAIKINGVYGKFGRSSFEVIANVYPSKEEKEKTETKTKQEKEAEKKAEEERLKAEREAKEAAKAEEDAKKKEAEETPKEEEKEEPKTEEVKENTEEKKE